MKEYRQQLFTGERALYAEKEACISDCIFDDGESPLKESQNILIIKVNDENTPIPNPYLVNAVIKGNYFYKRIQEGATIEKLQAEEGLKDSKYIRNLLNLRFLPPALTEQILNGTQDDDISLQKLIKMVA